MQERPTQGLVPPLYLEFLTLDHVALRTGRLEVLLICTVLTRKRSSTYVEVNEALVSLVRLVNDRPSANTLLVSSISEFPSR
jgi:hypothetical protein